MKLRVGIFVLVIGIASSHPLGAQTVNSSLDSFFRIMTSRQQLSGTALVANHDKIVFDGSWGYADREDSIPNRNTTEFALASVSKVFTSAAVLQLRDKSKLDLDDPVAKYLAGFPYPDIRIRNLLSHTSGLPDYQLYEEQMTKDPGRIFTNADILPALQQWKKALPFKPGERWQYSNTNYCLLALLVQRVSGMPFQEYLKRYLFAPAGMTNTYFVTDDRYKRDANKAIGYEYPFLFSENAVNVDSLPKYHWRTFSAMGFVGQGNIVTTSWDMLKFDQALYSGKLLKPATLNEAFTPSRLNNGDPTNANTGLGKASYGLGWFILADSSGGRIVWHTGGQPGNLSIFIRNLTRRQTVILFDNAFDRSLFQNGMNMMAILNGQPASLLKNSPAASYGRALVREGIDAGFCTLERLRADSAQYDLKEEDMNELGLQLLYAGHFSNHDVLALEVLKLNTLLFPLGFNTYDSYGEALAKTGRVAEAILMYRRSIALNPDNASGREALRQLEAIKQKE